MKLEDLAPNVLSRVPSKIRRTRTVFEAIQDHTWVRDIRNALGWHDLLEYLKLWDIIAALELNTTADFHQWKFKLEVSILPDQPTGTFLLVPSPWNLGSGFGNLGHLTNARLLFGWLFEIAAGQRTGYRNEASLIWNVVLFVIKI